jgi:hypothetical protein
LQSDHALALQFFRLSEDCLKRARSILAREIETTW